MLTYLSTSLLTVLPHPHILTCLLISCTSLLYLRTFLLLTYLSTYLPTYPLPTLHIRYPTYLHTYLSTSQSTYLLTNLLISLPTALPTYIPTPSLVKSTYLIQPYRRRFNISFNELDIPALTPGITVLRGRPNFMN